VEIEFPYVVQAGTDDMNFTPDGDPLSTITINTINDDVYSNSAIADTGCTTILCTINGRAWANSSISSNISITTSFPDTMDTKPLPNFNPGFWQTAAINYNEDPCSGGTKFITATTTIGGYYNCNVQVSGVAVFVFADGPIHITGTFKLKENTSFEFNPGSCTTGTVLMADGGITLEKNTNIKSNNPSNPDGFFLFQSNTSINSSTAGDMFLLSKGGQITINHTDSGKIRGGIAARDINIKSAPSTIFPDGATTIEELTDSEAGQYSNCAQVEWQIQRGSYRFVK